MTLSTLQTMNLPLADLAESLKLKTPAPEPAPPPAAAPTRPRAAPKAAPKANAKATAPKPAPAAVDPLQWWGALTQQFTELATQAVKDSAAEGAKGLAGSLVRQGVDSAAGALKAATRTGAAAAGAVKRAAAPPRRRK